jgi:hypothetical protein
MGHACRVGPVVDVAHRGKDREDWRRGWRRCCLVVAFMTLRQEEEAAKNAASAHSLRVMTGLVLVEEVAIWLNWCGVRVKRSIMHAEIFSCVSLTLICQWPSRQETDQCRYGTICGYIQKRVYISGVILTVFSTLTHFCGVEIAIPHSAECGWCKVGPMGMSYSCWQPLKLR